MDTSTFSIPSPLLYHLLLHLCPMPLTPPTTPPTLKKIRIHSPFLHARLPQMLPHLQYSYKSCRSALSASGTQTSHIPTSPLPVSSTTQTKKTSHPPYKQFHVLVPPFVHHSEEPKQPSPSQTMQPQTKPSSLPSLECATPLTVVTHTLWGLKRSSESLVPSDTEGCPAKTMKQRHSLLGCTKFDDWNLDMSRLPLRHQHPLTSPFRHLPFQETCKSRRVPRPPAPESAQWPADRLRPSNLVPEVPEVQGLKRAVWEEEYSLFRRGFASELSCCLLARQEELKHRLP